MAHILLIDDDPDILRLASLLLGKAGFEVTTAPNATVGLEQLKTGNFDLLISDANMPEYSGFDLVKAVRALKRFEKLPIALLTARRERQDVELALGLGVNDYIVKPLDPSLLLSKVENLLGKKPERIENVSQPAIKKQASNIHTTARITLDVQLVGMTEDHLTVLTHCSLPEGETITLDCSIFREMGIVPPPLIVRKTETLNDLIGHQVTLEFKAVNERLVQKIRAWLGRQDSLLRPTKKVA